MDSFAFFRSSKCKNKFRKKSQPRIHSSHVLKISEFQPQSVSRLDMHACNDSLLGKSNHDDAGMICGPFNSVVYLPNYLCLFGKRRNCLWENQIKNEEKKRRERLLGSFMPQYHPALPGLKNIATRRWELIQNQSHLKEIIAEAPPILSQS